MSCPDCRPIPIRAGEKPKHPIPLQGEYKPLRRIYVPAVPVVEKPADLKPESEKPCVVDQPPLPPSHS